ncbi:MAG: hybrid sensor histidine kinase/response regulator [Nitrospinae bacterium]|nr:hybrid sensor histidine kinase/response regulator [Nitrospinota bacterium]MBL7021503.1 hybrid sensor histidine kinase/response regulator [Nitrospinaceae bacterium]
MSQSKQKNILVVDDNKTLRNLFTNQFKLLGYKVCAVSSGLMALEYLEDNSVDVITLDYEMPEMDGLEVFQELQKVRPDIPVIMLTAYGNISLVERFMDLGGAGFLEKPCELSILDAKIQQILSNWKLKQSEASRLDLERVLKTLTHLLGSGAHEIRTALTVIEQRNRFLLNGVQGKKKEDSTSCTEECPKPLPGQIPHLEISERSVKRLLALVNELIDFSRIESGEIGEQTSVNLNAIAEETVDDVAGLLDEKPGVCIEMKLIPELPTIHGNPRRVCQIITNLLTNAMKFTDEGRILISTDVHPANGWVELAIRDTGVGINRDRQAKIFGEFTESTQSHLMTGSGLGLSIAQLLTHKMQGEIDFTSEEGKGSNFFLRFPPEPKRERVS